jgi:hypothetical protein
MACSAETIPGVPGITCISYHCTSLGRVIIQYRCHIFLKRNFLSDYVVRLSYKHSFLHRDVLQVLNPLLLETHAQPSVLGLGVETFLIKVNRGLVPLRGREHGSAGIRLVEQYLENRPIHTSAVLDSGQRSVSWVKQRVSTL